MSTTPPRLINVPVPELGTFTPHTYKGGCHCGRIKFSIVAPPPDEIVLTACNCSFCSARGMRMIYMKQDRLTVTKGSFDDMTEYRYNTRTGQHWFCPICGIAVGGYYQGTYTINMRCMDDVDVESMKLFWIDGKNLIPRIDGKADSET
ncbi:hypothetical protein EXIGLDRAFT_666913 [Exidia glandulosa HHB12029]|uniref:CENP-V/GFA domain-containing protein n=1 Tax=Exidia glandulosa HHB12029 TaxID=1314781 RepID=A0A165NK61_EXIGL|nr:hypothetical protein EXIGLDRAFT_666913 [Exidia glandulosa HHB12029]